MGQAIRLAVEDKVRYGGKIVLLDDGITQMHQMVFKELLGITVGTQFIQRHLSRYFVTKDEVKKGAASTTSAFIDTKVPLPIDYFNN